MTAAFLVRSRLAWLALPLAALVLTPALDARQTPAAAPAPVRTVLVTAARLIDGRGGAPIANAGVLIRGERIERGDYSGPAGARRVLRDPRVQTAVLETAPMDLRFCCQS